MSKHLGQDGRGRHDRQPAVLLTGRGAIVVMLALFTLGLILSSWLSLSVLTGVSYLAGCVIAARYIKPSHLLVVSVSPPLLFACALIAVKLATASGDTMISATGGFLLALAGAAPWLFGGTAAALAIAWYRGLPRCLAELRRDIRAEPDRSGDPAVTGGASASGQR